jgi:hypothetical protein
MTCILFICLSTEVVLLVAIVFPCLPDNIHVYFYSQNTYYKIFPCNQNIKVN